MILASKEASALLAYRTVLLTYSLFFRHWLIFMSISEGQRIVEDRARMLRIHSEELRAQRFKATDLFQRVLRRRCGETATAAAFNRWLLPLAIKQEKPWWADDTQLNTSRKLGTKHKVYNERQMLQVKDRAMALVDKACARFFDVYNFYLRYRSLLSWHRVS